MKVSATVKNYIRKEIEKAMPYKECPDISDIQKKFETLQMELKEYVKNAYINFFTIYPEVETTYKYDKDETMLEFLDKKSLISSIGDLASASTTEIKKFNDEIYKKRQTKFEDIVVTLELGGTKADLDKMLKELM